MDWLLDIHVPDFTSPAIWVSLITLVFLEIILGVDNIIFISIVSNKLPESQQKRARNIGLLFAMVFRLILLLMINWIISLKEPVFTIGWMAQVNNGMPLDISWKDIILLCGGIFLIVKSTLEIHNKMKEVDGVHHQSKKTMTSGVLSVIIQIIVIDMIFSVDSILTAVGLVEDVLIMMIAVVIAVCTMMLFAGPISKIINRHPSLQMLALSFLVVIGVLLVAEGIHQHISKSIIYSCLAFSLVVEMLNIRFRSKQEKAKKIYDDEVIDKLQ